MLRPALVASAILASSIAIADATNPTANKKGVQDNPPLEMLRGLADRRVRAEGLRRVFPSAVEVAAVGDRSSSHDNRHHEPKTKEDLERTYTRLASDSRRSLPSRGRPKLPGRDPQEGGIAVKIASMCEDRLKSR
jgi:hypothetical protein